ncbi:MAG: triose-phosphate isomerase [Candidatus Aenigmarchaeota archaeon]|nr:triose-phosphate isomerase [Candidatus Aenigmarchaeota archaeon]
MDKIVAANWKMNKSISQSEKFVRKLKKVDVRNNVIIFPSFIALPAVSQILEKERCGAQDSFYESSGAHTGEVSPEMIKEVADYVIIGHSERRAKGETNEILNKKVKACSAAGLKIIFCVGEKEGEDSHAVVKKQIIEGLKGTDALTDFVIIAYEPVWAIGTGKTPETDEIMEAVKYIKSLYSCEVLYGGSVNGENAEEILKICDGVLVGSASLDFQSFLKIARS